MPAGRVAVYEGPTGLLSTSGAGPVTLQDVVGALADCETKSAIKAICISERVVIVSTLRDSRCCCCE